MHLFSVRAEQSRASFIVQQSEIIKWKNRLILKILYNSMEKNKLEKQNLSL